MVQEPFTQKTKEKLTDLKLPFPWKLHKLLEDTDTNKTTDIISWLPDGTSFKVHEPKAFTEKIMPSYFSQTKFNSFRRQCYIYGFRLRLDGAFFHTDFRRDNIEACSSLQRNHQEDRRRRMEHKENGEITHLHERTNLQIPSTCSGFSKLPRHPSITAAGSTNSTGSLGVFEKTIYSGESESREEIMDFADKIFENNIAFNAHHYELLALDDLPFKNVPLNSLDEVFLSEIFEKELTEK